MEKTSFVLPALKEHKLLESWVCEEHYEVKVEIEDHIEEKVGEKLIKMFLLKIKILATIKIKKDWYNT